MSRPNIFVVDGGERFDGSYQRSGRRYRHRACRCENCKPKDKKDDKKDKKPYLSYREMVVALLISSVAIGPVWNLMLASLSFAAAQLNKQTLLLIQQMAQ
jgi:hypothetical protein